MTDLDFGMLDASEWQAATEPSAPLSLTVWRDAPLTTEDEWGQRKHGEHFTDTGAHSVWNRAVWLEARRSGIGASDIAAIMGDSRWGDAGTVFASKWAPVTREATEWEEWGHLLEPVIVGAYGSPRYAGRHVETDGRLLRSRAHPWAVTTLDAWTMIRDRLCPLEIKTDADRYGSAWEDGAPIEYAWQVQHQLLVTGARHGSIAALLGGSRLVWCDFARDEQMIARIIREGEAFWDRVQRGDMPPTRDHDALARVFRESEPRMVELSGIEWTALDVKRDEVSTVEKMAEGERRVIDAKIKHAMGRAEVARLDDGTEYRWKTQRDGKRVLRRKEAVIR